MPPAPAVELLTFCHEKMCTAETRDTEICVLQCDNLSCSPQCLENVNSKIDEIKSKQYMHFTCIGTVINLFDIMYTSILTVIEIGRITTGAVASLAWS